MRTNERFGRFVIGHALLVCCGLLVAPSSGAMFRDDFDGPDLDPNEWVINHPGEWWWVMGRTHFPEPSTAGLPTPRVENGACIIDHYHYNPYELITPEHPQKTTFLGGEIHTVIPFVDSGSAYRFEARVRWENSPGGLVTSFFNYGYDEAHEDSDEIDFEFLSNEVFDAPHKVHTNTWNDSAMKEEQVAIPDLDLTQWNTFRIYWYPGTRVVWAWVDLDGDEHVLREETDAAYIPDESMHLYFNYWAADDWWPKAYDASLLPDQQDNGIRYEYWIDYVEAVLAGDVNTDGEVDHRDIDRFVDVLLSGPYQAEADINWDGFVNGLDVEPFRQVLIAATAQAVPEPSAALLIVVGLVCLMSFRWRRVRHTA